MKEQQQPKRNNTCLDAGQLTAWRDGALPLREANEVTAHLAECARCAAEERALTRDRHQVFNLLSRLDPAPNTHAEPAIALTHFQERLAAQNTASLLQYSDEDIYPGALPPSRSEREDALLTPVRLPISRHHSCPGPRCRPGHRSTSWHYSAALETFASINRWSPKESSFRWGNWHTRNATRAGRWAGDNYADHAWSLLSE